MGFGCEFLFFRVLATAPRKFEVGEISIGRDSTARRSPPAHDERMQLLLPFAFSAALVHNNVLIVDHLNINHEKGRHDLASAFYFDLLGCVPDPRKADNLAKGKGTVWANAGIHQFHLSQGEPAAQVLDGKATLGYASLDGVRSRLAAGVPSVLSGSAFAVERDAADGLTLRDPWGSLFELVELDDVDDTRGSQPDGEKAEARCMVDLTLNVPAAAGASGLAGIGRYYEQVLGMPVHSLEDDKLILAAAGEPRADGTPRQTLSFALADGHAAHEEVGEDEEGRPLNRGAHISLYLDDMRSAYQRADRLGLTYVNHRFKRRAYTEEEAIDQCMFRMLDVVDPEDREAGPIIRIEHEVRSATKKDGTRYKSCPIE